MPEETISIITDEPPVAETRSWEAPSDTLSRHKRDISVDKLEQEMARFVQVVGRLFNRAEQEANKKPGMQLDEIEVTVEINSEGQMSLLGTGAKVGGKGGITLKFKRSELGAELG